MRAVLLGILVASLIAVWPGQRLQASGIFAQDDADTCATSGTLPATAEDMADIFGGQPRDWDRIENGAAWSYNSARRPAAPELGGEVPLVYTIDDKQGAGPEIHRPGEQYEGLQLIIRCNA